MMAEEYCSVYGWSYPLKKWVLIQSARTYFEVDMILSSPECRKYLHFKVSREVPVNVQEWRDGLDTLAAKDAARKELADSIARSKEVDSSSGEHQRGGVEGSSKQAGGTIPCPWD